MSATPEPKHTHATPTVVTPGIARPSPTMLGRAGPRPTIPDRAELCSTLPGKAGPYPTMPGRAGPSPTMPPAPKPTQSQHTPAPRRPTDTVCGKDKESYRRFTNDLSVGERNGKKPTEPTSYYYLFLNNILYTNTIVSSYQLGTNLK